MKALPCQTRGCLGSSLPAGARNRGIIALPNGQPYLIGRCREFPLDARCSRCKRPSRFNARDFGRLPELTVGELQAYGALDTLTKDWEGFGLNRGQALQAIGAGLMGPGSIEDAPKGEAPSEA